MLSLLLTCVAIGISSAGQVKPKQIAELFVTTKPTSAYAGKSYETAKIVSLAAATKLVVLSSSKEWARVVLAETEVAFVPAASVKRLEGITLKGAKDRVRYFERMAREDPGAASSYEYQNAPWVRLITIELAKGKTAQLPTPQATYSGSSEPPSLTVINDTGRELSVYLNGPQALSFTIDPGSRVNRSMRAGDYRVFATVNDAFVIPLRSTWELQQGYTHDITLYIR